MKQLTKFERKDNSDNDHSTNLEPFQRHRGQILVEDISKRIRKKMMEEAQSHLDKFLSNGRRSDRSNRQKLFLTR